MPCRLGGRPFPASRARPIWQEIDMAKPGPPPGGFIVSSWLPYIVLPKGCNGGKRHTSICACLLREGMSLERKPNKNSPILGGVRWQKPICRRLTRGQVVKGGFTSREALFARPQSPNKLWQICRYCLGAKLLVFVSRLVICKSTKVACYWPLLSNPCHP